MRKDWAANIAIFMKISPSVRWVLTTSLADLIYALLGQTAGAGQVRAGAIDRYSRESGMI